MPRGYAGAAVRPRRLTFGSRTALAVTRLARPRVATLPASHAHRFLLERATPPWPRVHCNTASRLTRMVRPMRTTPGMAPASTAA